MKMSKLTLDKSEKERHHDDGGRLFDLLHESERQYRQAHQHETEPKQIRLAKAVNHAAHLRRKYDERN